MPDLLLTNIKIKKMICSTSIMLIIQALPGSHEQGISEFSCFIYGNFHLCR